MHAIKSYCEYEIDGLQLLINKFLHASEKTELHIAENIRIK